MIKVIGICLIAASCFLYALKQYLWGRRKPAVEAALILLIMATVLTLSVVSGWSGGFLALIAVLFFTIAAIPLARRVSRRILGKRRGLPDPYGSADAMDAFMKGDISWEEANRRRAEGEQQAKQRIEWLSERRPILSVLEQHGVSKQDYFEMFNSLRSSALGDLAWDIVSTPRDLRELIQMKREGRTITQIWAHFRQFRND